MTEVTAEAEEVSDSNNYNSGSTIRAAANEKDKNNKDGKNEKRKYSFNIFDGTNACRNSQYADFIFEGDEEDLMADDSEGRHWESCQVINQSSPVNSNNAEY